MANQFVSKKLFRNDKAIQFGWDKKLGFYMRIWKIDRSYHWEAPENRPTEENIMFDENEVDDNLTVERALAVANNAYNLGFDPEEFERNPKKKLDR